jgi:hypothetical protein
MNGVGKEQRRIVSPLGYCVHIWKHLGLEVLGGGLLLVGALGVGAGILWMIMIPVLCLATWPKGPGDGFQYILLLLVCSGGIGLSWLAVRFGRRAMDRAEQMESVTTLTREMAARFPASESLMRASSELSVPQQDVLLRSAGVGSDIPAEQLLRASVAQKE